MTLRSENRSWSSTEWSFTKFPSLHFTKWEYLPTSSFCLTQRVATPTPPFSCLEGEQMRGKNPTRISYNLILEICEPLILSWEQTHTIQNKLCILAALKVGSKKQMQKQICHLRVLLPSVFWNTGMWDVNTQCLFCSQLLVLLSCGSGAGVTLTPQTCPAHRGPLGRRTSQIQGWLPLLQVPKPQGDQEEEREEKHSQTWHIRGASRGNLILLRRGRWLLNPRWSWYFQFNCRFLYFVALSLSVDAGIFSIIP